MFLGGIERNQLHEMGFRGIVLIALICFRYIFWPEKFWKFDNFVDDECFSLHKKLSFY